MSTLYTPQYNKMSPIILPIIVSLGVTLFGLCKKKKYGKMIIQLDFIKDIACDITFNKIKILQKPLFGLFYTIFQSPLA